MTTTGTSVRGRIHEALARSADAVVELSHSLHAEPELGFAEHRSCAKIAAVLAAGGYAVETGIAGLDTAFLATIGAGDLVVALCVEYDALPGIGHACGHNVNGAASVAAALALAPVAEELGVVVRVVGTPGEETLGGKIPLLEAGVFDGVDAALMVHAGADDEVGLSSYAMCQWEVRYNGAPSHAAAAPWDGVNAADAVALAYQAVGLLRQQLRPDQVVSFVIDAGGTAPNIIPAEALARIELRAATSDELAGLQQRVRRCLDAGAVATGAELSVAPYGNDFADLRQDPELTELYASVIASLGRDPVDGAGAPRASTDMGNVSHRVPAIQPMIGYDTAGAAHHTAAFAAHGTSASADRAVLDGGLAMALVVLELAARRGAAG
ncbi:M20 family metallopeptidase [Nocardioides ginsengisoli]|uniref:Peptidase M20 domain-containing protein 2 n=1 Tax=Nocardioides ginsengisoli TaxID=363868 RepID=A0ABW3VW85_9ACTN